MSDPNTPSTSGTLARDAKRFRTYPEMTDDSSLDMTGRNGNSSIADELFQHGTNYALPKFMEYFIYDVRLSTFRSWPKYFKIRPQMLASTGLFMDTENAPTHKRKCICFQCGCEIYYSKDWPHDPWKQHVVAALQLQNRDGGILCNFILSKKSLDFIRDVEKVMNRTVRGRPAISFSTGNRGKRPFYNCQHCNSTFDTDVGDMKVIFKPCCHKDACINCASKFRRCPKCDERVTHFRATFADFESSNIAMAQIGILPIQSILQTTQPAQKKEDSRNVSSSTTVTKPMLCKICYANEMDAAIVPCGHTVTCISCAAHVIHCPICRGLKENVMKLYFA